MALLKSLTGQEDPSFHAPTLLSYSSVQVHSIVSWTFSSMGMPMQSRSSICSLGLTVRPVLFATSRSLFLSPLQSAGVMSVYLFMKRYTAEEIYRPHPGFYRPRLSNCSDYSGQFLHPDAWVRGRSPSDISSDTSLQMNSNYPALLKCPDYDQMSSSPC